MWQVCDPAVQDLDPAALMNGPRHCKLIAALIPTSAPEGRHTQNHRAVPSIYVGCGRVLPQKVCLKR